MATLVSGLSVLPTVVAVTYGAGLFGAGIGFGVYLIVLGVRGVEPGRLPTRRRLETWLAGIEQLTLRMGLAAIAGLFMAIFTQWVVGTVAASLGAAVAPTLVGAKARRQEAVERTEALASWAEMLRDTIASASGLREAVAATAEVAPRCIQREVRELEIRLRSEHFADAMAHFADTIADPIADKVAVALIIASERRGQRVTEILSEVAKAAREHAEMQLRMEAARARTYTQALTVTTILLVMFLGMVVLSRDYLTPYDTATGQMVLLGIMAGWAAAFVGLVQMSKVRQPDRVLRPEASAVAVTP